MSQNIRIINSTGLPQHTEVIDLTSRLPLQGVQAVQVTFTPDALPAARVDMVGIVTNIEASPEYRIVHPLTGEMRTIAQITFAEGDHWP